MEVYEAVRTVLAVREFKDKPVPEEALSRIIEAAHLTASGMNSQPWHFIVVQGRDTIRTGSMSWRSSPSVTRRGRSAAARSNASRSARSRTAGASGSRSRSKTA